MPFEGPDAVKRAVLAGPGISSVSRLTVRDELASGKLVDLRVASPLFRRQFCVIDHPQKHHGHDVEDWLILGVMMSATREIGHPDVSLPIFDGEEQLSRTGGEVPANGHAGGVGELNEQPRPPAGGRQRPERGPAFHVVCLAICSGLIAARRACRRAVGPERGGNAGSRPTTFMIATMAPC